MTALRPTADISATGWAPYPSGTTGTGPIWSSLQTATQQCHRASRIRETRKWIFVGLDDARWDWIYARLSSATCKRSGQLAMQTLHDEVIAKGTSFASHRTTLGPCWTARAEWHTGLFFFNHGMNAHDTTSGGYLSDYVARYINGSFDVPGAGGRAANQTMGPFGEDLSFRAGYGRVRVSHAQQLADSVLRSGFTDDDLQAYTGAVWQQLEREGILPWFYGKISNPRQISHPIPAGIVRGIIQVEDSSVVTDDGQWNLWLQEVQPAGGPGGSGVYVGANPFNGTGALIPFGAVYTTQYKAVSVASISWSGGIATVTTSTNHNLDPAAPASSCPEQVTLFGTSNGYDFSYPVLSVPSNKTFTIATANSAGAGAAGSVYNRMNYGPLFYAKQLVAQWDAIPDAQPFYANFTPRTSHDNNGGYASTTHEREYEGSVAAADAVYWLGTAAATSPVCGNTNSTVTTAFSDSMQMMASLDDALAIIITYATKRWGADGFGIIVTSDQGIQNGEQGASYVNADGQTVPAFGDSTGKTFVWDGSARAMLYIRGPGFTAGATVTQPTAHADLGPTILDLFGLSDHHWITVDGNPFHTGTRDGRPLTRVTNASDVAHSRMLPVFGDFKTGSGGSNRGWAFIDKSGRKFIELNNTKATGKFLYPDPTLGAVVYNSATVHPAYEQEQITPTTADLNTYDAALTACFAFRFDPSSGAGSNPAHTTASP